MAEASADFLHRKIGPLTGLQWALLVGGGLGLVLLLRKRSKAATSSGTNSGLSPLGNGLFGDSYGNIYDQGGNLLSATQPTMFSAGANGMPGYGSGSSSNVGITSAAPLTDLSKIPWAQAGVGGSSPQTIGYGAPGVTNIFQSGTITTPLGAWTELPASEVGPVGKSGIPLYWQPTPGQFVMGDPGVPAPTFIKTG